LTVVGNRRNFDRSLFSGGKRWSGLGVDMAEAMVADTAVGMAAVTEGDTAADMAEAMEAATLPQRVRPLERRCSATH
jgi:hypothetical protein